MRVLVIIPAFNEAKNIQQLANNVNKLGYDYLIINDHSTDDTFEIIKNNNLNALHLVNNVGISAVTRFGFRYAVENDYDACVSIDGDGQHPPKYIAKLLQEIENGYDYVLGSRFIDKKKSWSMRMIGSRLISLALFLKTSNKIKDPTSGMRALGKNVLKEFSLEMDFIAEPDCICYLLKKNYKVKEVQVNMEERTAGISYFKSPIKSIKYMLSVLISIFFVQ